MSLFDKNTKKRLVTFENEMMRKIYEPTKKGEILKIKHNREKITLFEALDIVVERKDTRLRLVVMSLEGKKAYDGKKITRKTEDTLEGPSERDRNKMLKIRRNGGRLLERQPWE